MDDRARHRASVLVWLRQHGYRSLAQIRQNEDVRRLARSAGICEEDLMEPTEIESQGKTLRFEWLPPGQGPPSRTRPSSLYEKARDVLRAHPGQWACLGEGGSGAVSSLRKRGLMVRERQNGTPGKAVIYACWPAAKGKVSSPQR